MLTKQCNVSWQSWKERKQNVQALEHIGRPQAWLDRSTRLVFTPLRVGWPPTPQAFLVRDIYTFFGIKSVQNTSFCNVFNALASTKNFNSLTSPNP